MKLAIRPLVEVSGVNAWRYATEWEAFRGDPADLYFQLVDAERNIGLVFTHDVKGLRYMPPAASTLLVTFLNVNTAKQFNRAASQPFAQDPSIWRVQVLASDTMLGGTVSMKFALTEPGPVVRGAYLQAGLRVSGANEVC